MDTLAKINEPLKDFSLNDLDGKSHRLLDYRGKVTILNFWSAECDWSRRTDEVLLPLLDTWGDQVTYLAIAPNANESPEMLDEVADSRGMKLILHDSDHTVAALLGVEITPNLFVLDVEGVLRYQGAFDDVTFRHPEPSQHYLQDAVEALLTGKSPVPNETPAYGCVVVKYLFE